MKIIVVGATGTIGSKVVEALLVKHDVVEVARRTKIRVDFNEPATFPGVI
jgi:uncharacterized protein YbjT (DUF2867 family)